MNERWLRVAASVLAIGVGACSSTKGETKDPPSVPRGIITPTTIDAETVKKELIGRAEAIWTEAAVSANALFEQTRQTQVADDACVAWLNPNGLYTLVHRPIVWGYDGPDVFTEALVVPLIVPAGTNSQDRPLTTEVELVPGSYFVNKKSPEGSHPEMTYVNNNRMIFPLHPDKKITIQQVTVKPRLERDVDGNKFMIDETTGKPVARTMQVTAEAFPATLKKLCGVIPQDARDSQSPLIA